MKKNIKRFTVKFTSALLIASALMSAASTVARADEIDTEPTECVETVEEGQGDVIDDQFAAAPEAETQSVTETVTEAPAVEMPVALEVEGQGDVIDVQFAIAPELQTQPVIETVTETPAVEAPAAPAVEIPVAPEVEGQGDVIDDEFAVSEEEAWNAANEIRTAEMAKYVGVIGDTVTIAEEAKKAEEEAKRAEEAKKMEEERAKQLEEIVAELNESMKPAVEAMTQARLREETKVETEVETKKETKVVKTKSGTKKVVAPAISMDYSDGFFGYSGKEVNYKDLETGKFYLMQIPRRGIIPSFRYRVVKILGSHTNKGMLFDDVMVKYNKYHWNGTIEARNKETQVNENLLNQTPNHFFEITDDILVK